MPTVPQGGRAPVAAPPGRGYAVTPWGLAPVGRAMPRRRPLAVWLGWPVVTLGVYPVVWYHRVHREMAEFDPRREHPVVGPVLVLLLLGWTVVGALLSVAATARRVAAAQRTAGLIATCRPGPAVLLCLLLGAGVSYLQAELNKVADAYDARPGARVALRS